MDEEYHERYGLRWGLSNLRADLRSLEKLICITDEPRRSEMQREYEAGLKRLAMMESQRKIMVAEEALAAPPERERTAKLVENLFNKWDLPPEDRAALLGLSDPTCRWDDEQVDRADLLLLIHKNLRRLYYSNPEIRYTWVRRKNERFDHAAPLETMKKGREGLLAVHRYQILEIYH